MVRRALAILRLAEAGSDIGGPLLGASMASRLSRSGVEGSAYGLPWPGGWGVSRPIRPSLEHQPQHRGLARRCSVATPNCSKQRNYSCALLGSVHDTAVQQGHGPVVAAAVPTANRDIYKKHAEAAAVVFKEHGALKVVDTDDD